MKSFSKMSRRLILLSGLAVAWIVLLGCGEPESAIPARVDPPTTQTTTVSKRPLPSFMGDKLTTEGIELHLGEPGVVWLTWKTESEDRVFGFNVLRRTSPTGVPKKINEKPILGAGNSSTENFYEYYDKTVKVGDTFYYSLQEINLAGEVSDFQPILGRRVCHINLEAKTSPAEAPPAAQKDGGAPAAGASPPDAGRQP